jgi:sugar (pentulose or hexulose) kinase
VGAVLVGDDPDAPPVLPMIDYEQEVPDEVNARYAALVTDRFDRGGPMLHGATHIARQLLWAETVAPEGLARARHVLGLPQYWAFRLSGQARREITHLAAQSHLWNLPEDRPTRIVAERGWTRLLPPRAAAGDDLGPLRPALARRYDLPGEIRIRTGGHDSSANLYRYQAAGLSDFVLVSTGTWVVALADGFDPASLSPDKGMTLNADVDGRPVGGALCMGGREFALVAGDQPPGALANPTTMGRLAERGTVALPSFADNDGQLPGSAGQGRIVGPPPETCEERLALAVLYAALLTIECACAVAPGRKLILDGTFVRDPAFAATVAGMQPGIQVLVQRDGNGVASGAALLCARARRADLNLAEPEKLLRGNALQEYHDTWHRLCRTMH